ncbi:MAG: SGNH/GDSL hydrolase family protein [Saprospiraceae bacterium]
MKKVLFLFFFLSLILLTNCDGDGGNATQAGFVARGGQAEHLDRFEQEIQAFEAADKKAMPPKNAVLFVGSSSIRLWPDLAADFAPMPVINRGFGGSTIPEVRYYADRIIWKYEPRVIVFYCGENDVKEETPPAVVFQNFKKFIGEVERHLPGTEVVFVSAKPSPSRWPLWSSFQRFNNMAEHFAENRPRLYYVDISGTLLSENGAPDKTLFTEDMLHMNSRGYEKWGEVLRPVISRLLVEG